MNWAYLDNNATTRPDDAVLAAMDEAGREFWANPSSVHRLGQMARQRLELARASVARLLHCHDREVVFTSGGTEANNLALRGTMDAAAVAGPRALISTAIEHSAVRQPVEALRGQGVSVAMLPVDPVGRIQTAGLARMLLELAPPGAMCLVSVQWVNNETGVIQPVAELAALCREHPRAGGGRVVLHVDATQAVGKIPVDVRAAGVDLLTLSGHKFHGPKGAGALYVRNGVRLKAQVLGGPQERDRRGGTENTTAIVGLGVAAELAMAFVGDLARVRRQELLRDALERRVREALPDTVVNGEGAQRVWNTTNLGFPRLEAEAILLGLSERGVCVSAGAACSSGSLEPSPVLLAMGIPEAVAHGSVRLSLSRDTTEAEIDHAVTVLTQVVGRLRATLPMGV